MSVGVVSETLRTIGEKDQGFDYSYDFDEEDIDLSLLRFNSFGISSDRRRSNDSPSQLHSSASPSSTSATVSAGSPGKRSSPKFKDSDEPCRKKLFFRPMEDEANPNLPGYTKITLPLDFDPNGTRSSPLFRRSFSDSFASPAPRPVSQEASPASGNAPHTLPPRPPMFRRSVSDLTPTPSKTMRVSSSSVLVPEADLGKSGTSEADKMLLVIKDGVRELDQWCNKLIRFSQTVSSEKQKDDPKGVEETEEEKQEEFKEGVRLDRVGEAFVVEINCPCGKSYRTLFSGRDCYYKLL